MEVSRGRQRREVLAAHSATSNLPMQAEFEKPLHSFVQVPTALESLLEALEVGKL